MLLQDTTLLVLPTTALGGVWTPANSKSFPNWSLELRWIDGGTYKMSDEHTEKNIWWG